jgi:hypothetical protein
MLCAITADNLDAPTPDKYPDLERMVLAHIREDAAQARDSTSSPANSSTPSETPPPHTRDGNYPEVNSASKSDRHESLDPPDEGAIADSLLERGYTLEAAFVRHFNGRENSNWRDVVEAVCPGEDREWGTVKTWVTRVRNAMVDVSPRCRLTFVTSQREHKVIKKRKPE